jgi:hypothetical protein
MLAVASKPTEPALEAFGLYKKCRLKIPLGVQGWGAKGVLDSGRVREMVAKVRAYPAKAESEDKQPRPEARDVE